MISTMSSVSSNGSKAIERIFSCLLVILALSVWEHTHAQEYQHADSAFAASVELGKPLLLVFTGSDWCPHCRRLEKSVLGTSEFRQYASEKLVICRADFPQRKRLPEELVRQNEALAEKYNPEGTFPTLLLFSTDQGKLAHMNYTNQDV